MGVLNGARARHDYRRCRDSSCDRFACRVYREGYDDGHAAGWAEGEAVGHAEGYSEGHADGYDAGAASCGDG
jgi:flagellar biosynthesis/type III secretory pathway protein FliH